MGDTSVTEVLLGMNVADGGRQFVTNLSDALWYPFETWRGTIGLVVAAFVTYVVLILSTMPEFSLQMLGDSLYWFDDALVSLTETIYRTDGWSALVVVILYAVLTGVAVVNAVAQFRIVGPSSLTDLSAVLPGLLASGCASCGAGLLSFMGFAGALSVLPYDGALLRIAGLALLLFFLGRAGHPERCTITTGTSR